MLEISTFPGSVNLVAAEGLLSSGIMRSVMPRMRWRLWMAAPMMDVISKFLLMLDVPINPEMTEVVEVIDVVLVPDQEVVAVVDVGLHLDPGPGTASASLHPDPGLVIASADQAVEARSQLLAAVAGPRQLHNVV